MNSHRTAPRLAAALAAGGLLAGGLATAAPAQAAPTTPQDLVAVPDAWSTTAVQVTWEDGLYWWELEEAGTELTNYVVTISEDGETVDTDWTSSQVSWFDGLEPGTTYTVEVALDGEEGVEPATASVTTYSAYVGAPSAIAIQGSLTVGSQLSVATTGAWETGADVVYEWFGTLPDAQSSGPVIATGPTLSLTAAHLNMAIYVTATGTKEGLATRGLASEPNLTTRVTNPAPAALTTAVPTISGKAKVGEKLTVQTGSWTPGTAFTFQWTANGKAIAGATGSTLKLAKSHAGKKIAVVVTGALAGHATATTTSAQTDTVRAPKAAAKGKSGSKTEDKKDKSKDKKGKKAKGKSKGKKRS